MFDVTSEPPISIEKARHLPCLMRDGKPPHWSTVRSWIDVGIRGIRLESAEQPGGTVTSALAALRFVEKLTAAVNAPAAPTPAKERTAAQRDRAVKRAMAAVGAM